MSNDAPVHSFAQRWRDRREYRRPAEERIVPAEFGVEILRDRDAKAFVTQHHYSGSYPAARLAVGLMRRTERTVITAYGRDTAVASTLFYRDNAPGKVGRQMQTWVRCPEGWRIVAASVSLIDEPKA